MLVAVGVDVVGIGRLARARSHARDIIELVCAAEECTADVDDLRAARLWSGKEAVAKTLGTGFWQSGVDWKQIRIFADGRLELTGRAASIAGDDIIALDWSRVGDRVVAVALRWSNG